MSDQKSERGLFRRKKAPVDELKVWVDPESPEGVAAAVAASVASGGGMASILGHSGIASTHVDTPPDAAVLGSPEYTTEEDHPDSKYYYYDLRTGQVMYGPKGSWQHRLGPYKTPHEAKAALEIARERNKAWDKQSLAWR